MGRYEDERLAGVRVKRKIEEERLGGVDCDRSKGDGGGIGRNGG